MRSRLARIAVAAALAGGLGAPALTAPAAADPLPELLFAPGSDVDEVMRTRAEMERAAQAEWDQRMWEAQQAEEQRREEFRAAMMAGCGCDPAMLPPDPVPWPL